MRSSTIRPKGLSTIAAIVSTTVTTLCDSTTIAHVKIMVDKWLFRAYSSICKLNNCKGKSNDTRINTRWYSISIKLRPK